MANCIATCDPPYHIIPQSVPLGHNLQTLLYVIFNIFMHNLPQLYLNGWCANLRPEEKHYLLRICNVVQKVMWFWSLFFNLIGKLKMIVHKYWSNAPLRNMTQSGGKFNWYKKIQNIYINILYIFINIYWSNALNIWNITLRGGKCDWYNKAQYN